MQISILFYKVSINKDNFASATTAPTTLKKENITFHNPFGCHSIQWKQFSFVILLRCLFFCRVTVVALSIVLSQPPKTIFNHQINVFIHVYILYSIGIATECNKHMHHTKEYYDSFWCGIKNWLPPNHRLVTIAGDADGVTTVATKSMSSDEAIQKRENRKER